MTFAFPPLTPMVRQILILLGAVFAAQVFLEHPRLFNLGQVLYDWVALSRDGIFSRFAVWELVTYGLLHGGLMHLLFNMLGLYMFGGDVERVLGSRGLLRYVLICVAGGGAVYVATALLSGSRVPVVGASAGVIGVVVAFAVFFPHRPVFVFPLPFPIKARTLAIVFVVLDLYGALMANSGAPGSGGATTAFTAHLGGALIGFVYLMTVVRPGGLSKLTGSMRDRGRGGGRKRRPFDVIDGDRDDRGPWNVH